MAMPTMQVVCQGVSRKPRQQALVPVPSAARTGSRPEVAALGEACYCFGARSEWTKTAFAVVLIAKWIEKWTNSTDFSFRGGVAELIQAEREAKDARRGLWKDDEPIPPWEWWKGKRD